ncbi:MAG: class I SAM-dependent methyltransferase [Myxococcota bacterium]
MSSTAAGYDHLAPKFEATPFRTPDALLDRVADHLRPNPPASVLDLCCGTGAVLRRWAPLGYTDGAGVDFSPGMLAEAARFAPPPGVTVRWIEADVLRWTPDRAYDVVTSFGAFGHFEPADQPALLDLVRRSLAPGGRFVFVTGPRPTLRQPGLWFARGFNAAMRIRNAIVPPPFVMYYLTFSLPDALARCREAGFDPVVTPLGWDPRPELVLVEARVR